MANENNIGGIAGPNDAQGYTDDGNTSVNNRAYGATSPGKTIGLMVVAALVFLAIGAVGWFWVIKPMRDASDPKTVKVESSKREFTANLPVTPAQAAQIDCPTVALTQANGQPLIGANGSPITVDCNGKTSSQVPAPSGLYQGPAAQGAQTAPPPSPYRGGVILKDDTAKAQTIGMPSLPPMPDLSALQALMKPRSGAGSGSLYGGASEGDAIADKPRNVRGAIGGMLGVTATETAKAGQLKRMPYLLPKGRQIDCALTTRIVSEVSGFASCVLTSNVFSVDGKTLLLERGSEVDGEYQAGMKRGQRRLFVLWNRVRTPNGVYVNLASPNADALGTMGLPGYVDNKWFERIGSAFLLSLVQDGLSAAVGSDSVTREFDANGNVTSETGSRFTNTTATVESSIATVLADQISIEPTLYANQGDRVSIYVARDVNFEDVYGRK